MYIHIQGGAMTIARLSTKAVLKRQEKTLKLDGVGPVDNIPATNKLHRLIKKKKKRKK